MLASHKGKNRDLPPLDSLFLKKIIVKELGNFVPDGVKPRVLQNLKDREALRWIVHNQFFKEISAFNRSTFGEETPAHFLVVRKLAGSQAHQARADERNLVRFFL